MRSSLAVIGFTLVTAACGSADPGAAAPTGSPDPPGTTTAAPGVDSGVDAGVGLPEGPSALDSIDHAALPTPLVDPEEVISGGPPPDGIPSIDEPVFRSIGEAEVSLADTEAVVVLDIDGDSRAYPVEILIWHEIVNDTVGGVPVTVTYCPLCNSAVSYHRTVRGVETTFGTSGSLYASALVMYDRATESLWTHFDGRAVAGVLTGDQLEPISSPLLSWADFKTAYPEGRVLSRDTGFQRNYGQNPYFGYDNPNTSPALFRGSADERAKAKQRVVGVSLDDADAAFTLDAISGGAAQVTPATVGGTDIVIFWKAGQTTALEGADTSDGRDVGSVGVFVPEVDDRRLTFAAEGGEFVDAETGTTWGINGRAVSGELAGARLEQIPHLDTFWFAWSTYRPGTSLFEG